MAASAFDVLMGKTAKPAPEYWAVIYERVLRWPVDPEDPLLGTPYFGQAVRPVAKYESAQALAKARWREEDRSSKRGDGSDACFLEALRLYGPDAFDDRVVEYRRGACQSVQTWADERERAEIAAHGGTLRTMEPKPGVRQCWNVRPGGKGSGYWRGRFALHERPWKRFLEEMQSYCAAFGSARVPQNYVAPSGYKLGIALSNCRKRHSFLAGHADEAARRAALEALPGWLWRAGDDADYMKEVALENSKKRLETLKTNGTTLKEVALKRHAPKWERFLKEMQLHCVAFGSARVPFKYIAPSGYKLGGALNRCRSQNMFLAGHVDEAERRAALEALPGWLWRVSDDAEYAKELLQQTVARAALTRKSRSEEEKVATAKKTSETRQSRSEEQKQQSLGKRKLTLSKRTGEDKAESAKKRRATFERNGVDMRQVALDREARALRKELLLARSVAVPFEKSQKKRAAMRAASTMLATRQKRGTVLYMITKDGQNIARVSTTGNMPPANCVGPRVDPPAAESH